MSKTIDSKVVEMKFDNSNFEKNVSTSMSTLDKLKKSLKFEDSAKGFESISKAAGKVDMSVLSNGVETVRLKFSALEMAALKIMSNIEDSVINAGKKIANALTIEPITTGFQEYETQINATQTILANTQKEGATINDVNRALDELNKYADLTIYNFTEMTRNIGTFTAAGVNLDTSVNAIQGIANLAAVSGSTSQQASTAMYQLSQALASGTVKLMDWNSVVNAGMGGQVFQDALKTTARIHGIAIDEMITDEGSFRETLQNGWLTSDILTETLQHFTEFSDTYNEESLKRQGYNEEEIAEIKQLGITATDAATKVKTFSQLWDVMKETAQSGWSATWKIIVGDFEEAKSTLTEFSEALNAPLEAASEARNAVLRSGFSSGWGQLLNEGIEDTEGFKEALISLGKEANPELETLIEEAGGFAESLKSGWVTSDMLAKGIENLTAKTAGLSDEQLEELGYTRDQVTTLENLNEKVKAGGIDLEDYAMKIGRMSGRENIIVALKTAFEKLSSAASVVSTEFREIFPAVTGKQVYDLTVRIKDFVSGLTVGDEALEKFKMTFKGAFAGIDIVWQLIKSLADGIGRLIKAISPAGDGLLSMSSSLGEWLVQLDESIKKNDTFTKALDKICDFAEKAKTGISEFGKKLKETFHIPDFEQIKQTVSELFTSLKGRFETPGLDALYSLLARTKEIVVAIKDRFVDFFSTIGNVASSSGILDILGAIWEAGINIVKDLGGGLADIVAAFFKGLTDIDFSGVLDTLNGITLIGIGAGIKKFIKKLTGGLGDIGDIGESIKKAFDGLRGTLQAYQNSLNADALLKIAGAIGIMAGSLILIAGIDSERLAGAVTGITFLVGELVAAMKILNAGDSSNKSRGGLLGMFLGKGGSDGSSQLIAIAAAVGILSLALSGLGKLDDEQLGKGLGAITMIMTELVAASKLLASDGKKSIKGMSQMILLAFSLKIFVSVCKGLGAMSWEEILKGITGIGTILLEFAGFQELMKLIKPKKMVSSALSLVLIGAALEIFANVCKKFSGMTWPDLGKAGVAIAGILALASGFSLLSGMAKHMTSSSVALVIIGAALEILANVCTKFAGMDWTGLAKAGVAITGILALSAGFVLLAGRSSNILAASSALLIIAAAIRVLTPALQEFGQMSAGEIVKSLVMLAGAFTVIGIAGLALKRLVPAILYLGAAFALVGIGCLSLGAGLTLIATGISALGVSIAAAATGIVSGIGVIILGILDLVPAIIDQCRDIIVSVCNLVIESAPTIGEAIKSLVLTTCDVLIECVPQIVETVLLLLESLLDSLVAHTPTIVDSLFDFLIALINGVAERMPDLIAAGVNLVMSLLQGIVDALNGLDTETLVTAVLAVGMLVALMSVLSGVAALVGPAMVGVLAVGAVITELSLVLAAIGGLSKIPGISELISDGGQFLQTIGTAIGQFIGGIVGGLLEGVTSSFPQIGTDLSDFMTNLQPFIDGAKGIDSTVLDGVTAVTGAILLLTAASFIEGITSLLTLGVGSLSRLGEELATFGPQFATFADSIADINVEAVNASAAAISAIAAVLGGTSGSGPISSLIAAFTGTKDLDKFGDSLEPFGKALVSYGEAVDGIGTYQKDIDASKTAAESVIEVAGKVPNSGGWLGTIVGNNDLDAFGETIEPFGNALLAYGKSVVGMSNYLDDITNSKTAADSIIAIAKEVPNTGGWLGGLIGNNDLDTFGSTLETFGKTIMAYAKAISGISTYQADLESSSYGAEHAVNVAAIAKEADGGQNLTALGSNLVTFGSDLKAFVTDCSGLNANAIEHFETILKNITAVAADFATIDTSAIVEFVESMEKISQTTLDDFLNSFTNSSTAATNAINTLVSNLTSALSKKESTLKEKFKTVASNARKGLAENSVKADFKSSGEALVDKIAEGVSGKGQTVVEKFATICSSSVNAIRNQYSSFKNAGSYLTAGFSAGINSNKNAASLTGKEIANAASGSMERALDEHSPSKVGYKIGDYLGVGFINGLLNNVSTTGLAGEEVADSARSGLTAVVSQITDLIENGMDANPTITPVLDLTEVQNGVAAMSGLMSTLSGHSIEGTVNVAAKTANGMNRTAFASSGEKAVASTSQNNVTNTNNFYITGTNAKNIADEVDRVLQKKIERRKIVWA